MAEVSGDMPQLTDRLTPVSHSQRLFLARVEHGADNHETGGDGALAHPQNDTNDEESSEIRACRMTSERNPPYEDVGARSRTYQEAHRTRLVDVYLPHPFGYGKAL